MREGNGSLTMMNGPVAKIGPDLPRVSGGHHALSVAEHRARGSGAIPASTDERIAGMLTNSVGLWDWPEPPFSSGSRQCAETHGI